MKNFFLIVFSTGFALFVCEFSLGLINFSKYKNEFELD